MPWTQIVDDYGEIIYRAAYQILSHASDAEDVTQDVLLEAYRRFRDTSRLPDAGLLRRMGTLRAIDRLRRRKFTAPLDDSAIDSSETPEQAMDRETLADRLKRLIGRLPNRQAECFLLRHAEGLNIDEISNALGIKPSAVSTALHKARTHLREAMRFDRSLERMQ